MSFYVNFCNRSGDRIIKGAFVESVPRICEHVSFVYPNLTIDHALVTDVCYSIRHSNVSDCVDVASGIAMSIYGTIFQAASFMFNRKVPLTVAVRTLLHPSQRRASDLK